MFVNHNIFYTLITSYKRKMIYYFEHLKKKKQQPCNKIAGNYIDSLEKGE